ncbi:MAG: c-type cytochrome biogenesis protein CcmI [Pseudohongiellaceae bacterium]
MFWLLTVCLFVIAMLFVLVPLWRYHRGGVGQAAQLRSHVNLVLFEEHKKELDTELAAGNMGQEQYDSLLLELQRSLLHDVEDFGDESPAEAGVGGRLSSSKLVPLVLVLLLPLTAYGLYYSWGYMTHVALNDAYERAARLGGGEAGAEQSDAQARDLVVELGEAVQRNDENEWAWFFLGRSLSMLNLFNESAIAFQRAANLMEDGPDKASVLGQLAQIRYIMAEGELTPEVQSVIDQARSMNSSDLNSLRLLAIDAENRQDLDDSIRYWRLLIQANPNSVEAQSLRGNIATAQQLLNTGDDQAAGPRVEVNVSLAPGVRLPAETRIFMAAHNAERQGMPPLAATSFTAADLPASITLTNANAPSQFDLSSADTVYVTVLASRAGTANPQPGDYRVVSQNFAPNGEHVIIDLELSSQVP